MRPLVKLQLEAQPLPPPQRPPRQQPVRLSQRCQSHWWFFETNHYVHSLSMSKAEAVVTLRVHFEAEAAAGDAYGIYRKFHFHSPRLEVVSCHEWYVVLLEAAHEAVEADDVVPS